MVNKKMKIKEMGKDFFPITRGNRTLMYLFLTVMLIIWSIPVYALISESLMVNGLENYVHVLKTKINDVYFYQYFVNSGINAVCASMLLVLVCSLAGFSFSKIKFTGSRVIYNFVITSLAISGASLIIPLFYIYNKTHLYNTNVAVFLSETLITIPFGVLMMKNYFDGLPVELMESAKVDGASMARTFFDIYLPLAKPAVLNLAILQIMWSFQDFLFPLMFLTKEAKYTTTVAVNSFRGAYGFSAQDLGYYNAALVIISIPTILIFIYAQRFIVNGVTSGSVKE